MVKRLAARTIADFQVDSKDYQVDLDLSSRGAELNTEIERLSLLGVGAYGFLLIHVAMNGGQPTSYMGLLKQHPRLLTSGIACFALAGACALFANFLSSNCVRWQVDILRMFGRLASDRWNADEQAVNLAFAKSRQATQGFWLRVSWVSLFVSTLLLGTGAIVTAIVFAKVLWDSRLAV